MEFTEDCMRKLELADSVVLPPNAHEYRKRRKDFIDSINVSFLGKIIFLPFF